MRKTWKHIPRKLDLKFYQANRKISPFSLLSTQLKLFLKLRIPKPISQLCNMWVWQFPSALPPSQYAMLACELKWKEEHGEERSLLGSRSPHTKATKGRHAGWRPMATPERVWGGFMSVGLRNIAGLTLRKGGELALLPAKFGLSSSTQKRTHFYVFATWFCCAAAHVLWLHNAEWKEHVVGEALLWGSGTGRPWYLGSGWQLETLHFCLPEGKFALSCTFERVKASLPGAWEALVCISSP